MTFNEWVESLGNMDMTTVVALLVFIVLMFAFMPLIGSISTWLAETITNAIFGTVERAWKFVTERFRESR